MAILTKADGTVINLGESMGEFSRRLTQERIATSGLTEGESYRLSRQGINPADYEAQAKNLMGLSKEERMIALGSAAPLNAPSPYYSKVTKASGETVWRFSSTLNTASGQIINVKEVGVNPVAVYKDNKLSGWNNIRQDYKITKTYQTDSPPTPTSLGVYDVGKQQSRQATPDESRYAYEMAGRNGISTQYAQDKKPLSFLDLYDKKQRYIFFEEGKPDNIVYQYEVTEQPSDNIRRVKTPLGNALDFDTKGKTGVWTDIRGGYEALNLDIKKTLFAEPNPAVTYKESTGIAAGIRNKIRDRPLDVAFTYGAGYVVGSTGVVLSSIGTKTSTVLDVGGKVLGTIYFGSKGLEIANAPKEKRGEIIGSSFVEITAFSFGAQSGANYAISKGFIPQPSAAPTIRYQEFRVNVLNRNNKVIDSEKVLYRYFETYKPNTGVSNQIIGYGQGKIGVGNYIPRLTAPNRADVTTFSSQTSIKILNRMGVAGQKDVAKLTNPNDYFIRSLSKNPKQSFREIERLTFERGVGGGKSKIFENRISRDIRSFKYEKNIDLTLKSLNSQKNLGVVKAAVKYGSSTMKPQLRNLYQKQLGSSGDIDVQLFKGETYSVKYTKGLAKNLRAGGESSFVTKDQPFLIQTRSKLANHQVDIHPYGSQEYSEVPVQESFYGKPFFQKTIKIEGGRNVRLSEQNLRLASSVFTPRIREGKVFFAPESHRIKDVSRLVIGLKQETELIKGVTGREGVIDVARFKKTFNPRAFETQTPASNSPYSIPKNTVSTGVIAVSPSVSPGVTSRISSSPMVSRSNTISVSRSQLVSKSSSVSVSKSISVSPSVSISSSRSPSRSVSPSVSPSRSISPSPSRSPSPSPSRSVSPSRSLSPSPSLSKKTKPVFKPLKIMGGQKGKETTRKYTQFKTKYLASVEASFFNIKGAMPSARSISTGLNIRPIARL